MRIKISDSYNQLSEDDIKQLEKKVNFRLPDEFRQFLLENNGGYIEPDTFDMLAPKLPKGTRSSAINRFLGTQEEESYTILRVRSVYRGRIPTNFLPIGEDPYGNLICISVSGDDRGKVYFWDHEEEANEDEDPNDYQNVYLIADSFDAFLEGLYEYKLDE